MMSRIPMPIPIGWYCVGYSDELACGQVKNLHYFDRDMVLFRTEAGEVGLVDPVCPHLGAHLGYGGEVVGESIRCPFHHWQYDRHGLVTGIPYAKAIPSRARNAPCLGSYHAVEANDVIWAWYHPQDAAPEYEVIQIPELVDPDWVEQDRYFWTFDSHPQEIAENGVDVAHFRYVHRMAGVPEGETTYDGHIRRSIVSGKRKLQDADGKPLEIDASIEVVQNGAGQKWTRFKGLAEYLLQVLVTPISHDRVELRFAYTHRRYPDGSAELMAIQQGIAATNGQQGVEGDIPIWHHKFHLENPLLCDGDGPIMRYRRYFSQFYPEPRSSQGNP